MKIGVDVGGTFTDFLLLDAAGNSQTCKVLSTPDDPSRAVFAGFAQLAERNGHTLDAFLHDVEIIVHGTTVTTNAVLTGKIAPVGLLTTHGFRDALQMRRGMREVQYDNKYPAPEPLIPRRLRRPVVERIDAQGEVLQPILLDDVDDAVQRLTEAGVEAVAVCFMHAYRNDEHERAAAERVADQMPDAYLSVSSRVLPQVRFYERVSTTVLSAGVGPILSRYLDKLVERLDAAVFRGVLLIMQSNGGVTGPKKATALAASTLLSGPAAAPVAGLAYADVHAIRDLITVDMGGTSFDAALVKDGAPSLTTASRVNRHALGLETMDINTIGAGGGSIAWIDDGGMLRMGPDSAGATPGPACYGQGGVLPTCTDANLLLGYLSPDYFAGGSIKLDAAAAETAVEEEIAQPLAKSAIEAAYGMYQVINTNMASAIREISVQKGYDPRDFLLVCAGGAGPIHAAHIAAELEIRKILIPRQSSIFCAAGMLHSDLKHDFVRSYNTEFQVHSLDLGRFSSLVEELSEQGRQVLSDELIPPARQRFSFALDLRYLGQYHEVKIPVDAMELDPIDFAGISKRFHETHDRLYGYSLATEQTAITLVNLRMSAMGITDKPTMASQDRQTQEVAAKRKGQRAIFVAQKREFAPVDVYDGDAMGYGDSFEGPAIVEQRNTTVLIPPGFRLECDPLDSFLLEVE